MLIDHQTNTALREPPRLGPELGLPLDWRADGVVAPERDAYGRSIAALFGVDASRTAATTTLRSAQLGVTRLSSSVRGKGLTSPLPAERAYGVFLQLRDAIGNELWKAGRPAPAGPFLAGTLVIAKLEDEPAFHLREPFDSLFIHLPVVAFDELSADHGAAAITDLSDEVATPDPVVRHLGCALLSYLDHPRQEERLFFDHIVFAIHSRLASRYGRRAPAISRPVGGLTPRQERLAKAALIADLGEEPSLAAAAAACGVPLGRFARAFRQTTGMPPYRWLRAFRVERAKDLLLGTASTLAGIAYDCGFSDQSHFTRVFTAAVGTTPGAWRRGRRG